MKINPDFMHERLESFADAMLKALALATAGQPQLVQDLLDQADQHLASMVVQLGRQPKILVTLERL